VNPIRAAAPARLLVATVAAAAIAISGCGTPQPSPVSSPSPSSAPPGVFGRDWEKAELVEQPPGDPLRTQEPYSGGLGHPARYQGGQADVLDVVAGGPGYAAVGFLDTPKGPRAAAWASIDGRRWTLVADFPTGDGSVVRSVAIGEHGLVAVGVAGREAAAWRSADGLAWQRSPTSASLSGPQPLELLSVSATAGGYVAVGYEGPSVGSARPAFWSSSDGIRWERARAPNGAPVGRAEAVAAAGDVIVAVGTAGTTEHPTGGLAWTSRDGRSWAPVEDGRPFESGKPHGVSPAADGFIAVGANLDNKKAIVWRSQDDGRTWARVPDAPSLDNYGLAIEMRDVTLAGSTYIAVGHLLFGTQYSSGVIWSSPDGTSWTRSPDAPMFQQAKVVAVVGNDRRAVAVGFYGAPDFFVPTIWFSPPGG
jgi:hypothetical protein